MEIIRQGIYWVNFGDSNIVGCEQKNTRPCVIVGNYKECLYSPCSTIIPLTSQVNKVNLPTHVLLTANDINKLDMDSIALAEQIKSISKERITSYIGKVDDKTMKLIDKALKVTLQLEEDINKSENNMIGNKVVRIVEPSKNKRLNFNDRLEQCIENIKAINEVIANANKNNFMLLSVLKQEKNRYLKLYDYLCEQNNVDTRAYSLA